ncbi:MAG: hypothetical protein FWD31_06555 [Planctomycetaceae bacterium]|nr:hypothetical protein [Planctomycetaceae bacterium]
MPAQRKPPCCECATGMEAVLYDSQQAREQFCCDPQSTVNGRAFEKLHWR